MIYTKIIQHCKGQSILLSVQITDIGIEMSAYTSIFANVWCQINPFNPEFTIVTFIHYKPRSTCSE